MDLRIYIDFKSPTAYLAMQPTLALLDALPDCRALWLPFDARQRAVPAAKPNENRSESHFRVRAEARQATHLYYAEVQDVPMSFAEEPGETTLALAAMMHCQPLPLPFIAAAFQAYWRDQANLNDPAIVNTLLEASQSGPEDFNAGAMLEKLETVRAEAQELGVIDTPAYIVDGQLFIGREHLPWIGELLRAA